MLKSDFINSGSRTVGINDLVVQDGEGNTATLNPAFHVQENRFETGVNGSTIRIKTGWVNPTKVYVGNSTEPANSGTSNFAWTDVKLADYTAKDSDTAIIPIRVEYNDGGISSKRELQLSVKWTQEQPIWLAGATFTVKGPKQTDWTAAEFDPATTEYTVDIANHTAIC